MGWANIFRTIKLLEIEWLQHKASVVMLTFELDGHFLQKLTVIKYRHRKRDKRLLAGFWPVPGPPPKLVPLPPASLQETIFH